jgi:hypothetical protein
MIRSPRKSTQRKPLKNGLFSGPQSPANRHRACILALSSHSKRHPPNQGSEVLFWAHNTDPVRLASAAAEDLTVPAPFPAKEGSVRGLFPIRVPIRGAAGADWPRVKWMLSEEFACGLRLCGSRIGSKAIRGAH